MTQNVYRCHLVGSDGCLQNICVGGPSLLRILGQSVLCMHHIFTGKCHKTKISTLWLLHTEFNKTKTNSIRRMIKAAAG